MEPPTLKELQACQFSSWYPTFRSLNSKTGNVHPLNNVTIRSIIIKPLPKDFIEYLKADGVVLPKGAEKVSSFLPTETNDDWSSSAGDEEGTCSEDEDTGGKPPEPHFPELNEKMQKALDTLGGVCMPKLNWSAPKDVAWMNESSLKCKTIGDIYLLLKSSDFCMFDLEHALDDVLATEAGNQVTGDSDAIGLEYELILRKWSNLHASMEFRAFVCNHDLVAICQRNHTQHYPHLKKEYMEIRSLIVDFFHTYIRENYAEGAVPNYLFDVYVDKNNRVWLIDFNLWSKRTDALMFTWEEITTEASLGDTNQAKICEGDEDFITIENTKPKMRVVMNENEVHYDPLSSYRAPIDAVYLASDQIGSENFKAFMAMCEKPSDACDES